MSLAFFALCFSHPFVPRQRRPACLPLSKLAASSCSSAAVQSEGCLCVWYDASACMSVIIVCRADTPLSTYPGLSLSLFHPHTHEHTTSQAFCLSPRSAELAGACLGNLTISLFAKPLIIPPDNLYIINKTKLHSTANKCRSYN